MCSSFLTNICGIDNSLKGPERHFRCNLKSLLRQPAPPGVAGEPIEVSGKVAQIRIALGGMPSFDLKHGDETTRVYLGPMPFLIAENFNPKAGRDVVVKGYKLEDRIIASQITFVAEKRTIKFRDDQGWPLWRGGFGRGGRH